MLRELIKDRRDEIVVRTHEMTSLRSMQKSSTDLNDTMPRFLDLLSEALRSSPARGMAVAEEARVHGSHSSGLELSVSQVVHRYGDICQAVVELAMKLDQPIDAAEFGAFSRLLDECIASALVEYEIQRDTAILRNGAEIAVSLALTFKCRLAIAIAASSALANGPLDTNGRIEALLDESLQRLQALLDQPAEERRGTRVLNRERVFLDGVIQEATARACVEASLRGVGFFELLPGVHAVVWADRRLLVDAVAKLVRHVLRFTSSGGRVAVKGRGGSGRAWIDVETKGGPLGSEDSGAPDDARERQRGEHQDLVRQLWPNVAALGAQLSLHDGPQRGYVFTLTMRMVVV